MDICTWRLSETSGGWKATGKLQGYGKGSFAVVDEGSEGEVDEEINVLQSGDDRAIRNESNDCFMHGH